MPINTASKMLHCQVNDLLDSSLLLKGKFVMHLARFDLVKAVQEVVAVIEYGNSRQNKIEIFFETKVPQFIISDMNRLQ